ncbi:serine peptidase [Saccharothrix hoggarensis]|uniref:Serine peptidase n=1 Tax=Saccharothrix hoggarensis TaxID=913853 RepID=A0ABW3R2P4_9PSEU
MTSVLGVHGIGNYKYFRRGGSAEEAAALLAEDWRKALRRAHVDLDVAYYAHHLHRGTAQGPQDDPATLEPGAQELLLDWTGLLRRGSSVPQGPRTVRARQAADWITRNFGPAARLFAIAFCREVHTYLSRPDSPRRDAVRRTVADAIARRRPNVVVAHSLGSVVAYETLWAHQNHDVDLLVTIGSPLAMPGVVAPRLHPAATAGGTPPRVRRWVNVADVGDLVAIPRTGLRDHFPGVERDVTVTIGEWDFHTATGYLRNPEVAALVG